MHNALNERIATFETIINRLMANPVLPAPELWEGVWEEQNAIINDFRTVKYPSKEEKDAAWETFTAVRETFRLHQQDLSTKELEKMAATMETLRYDKTKGDLLANPTFEIIKAGSEIIKSRQKGLAEVVETFKAVKYLMTKDDKGTLVALLDATRASQQVFWDEQQVVYVALREAKDKEYSDKQSEYLRKQQQFKDRLAMNIKNNEERLQKALNYKINVQDQIIKHNEKLNDDIGDIFRERVTAWKVETEKKLEDVCAQIAKYEQYIAEDSAKMATVGV
jgi:hypothetical protein